MLLPLVLACSATPSASDPAHSDPPPSTGDTEIEHLGGDTSDPGDPPDDPHACADLYDEDVLPAFAFTIDDAEWDALEAEFSDPGACGSADPKPSHPLLAFEYDGESVTDATVRLKGNECFSWIAPKMQFVVRFDEVDPDARFHGLRAIQFDAPWYDASLLHERLAMSVFRDLGLAAPCGNNSTLTVNGAYYGAYANIEREDHEFLERVYGKDAAGGTLYKYGTEAVSNAEAADGATMTTFWTATDATTLVTTGSADEWLAEWAAEAVLPDGDGYQCCNHNWMLYDHPTDGLQFVPYDLDYSFDGGDLYYPLSSATDPMVPTWGAPQAFAVLLGDPSWRAAYVTAVKSAAAQYDVDGWLDRVDRWSAQVDEAVADDPNKTFTDADHARAVQLLVDFLPDRAAWLESWAAAH